MKTHKPKMPKDLQIRMGTPLEAMWNKVVIATEMQITNLENELIVSKAMLETAKQKRQEAKEN